MKHVSGVDTSMRNPLIRAAAATAGTFVILGGITMGVSTVTMGVVRTVLKRQKVTHEAYLTSLTACPCTAAGVNKEGVVLSQRKVAVECKPCRGQKYLLCTACTGMHVLHLLNLLAAPTRMRE